MTHMRLVPFALDHSSRCGVWASAPPERTMTLISTPQTQISLFCKTGCLRFLGKESILTWIICFPSAYLAYPPCESLLARNKYLILFCRLCVWQPSDDGEAPHKYYMELIHSFTLNWVTSGICFQNKKGFSGLISMGCEYNREKNQEGSYSQETSPSLPCSLLPFHKNVGFLGIPAQLLKATGSIRSVEY